MILTKRVEEVSTKGIIISTIHYILLSIHCTPTTNSSYISNKGKGDCPACLMRIYIHDIDQKGVGGECEGHHFMDYSLYYTNC